MHDAPSPRATRYVRPSDIRAAAAGLALHRIYLSGTDEDAAAVRAELSRAVADPWGGAAMEVAEVSPEVGYRDWATTYDDEGEAGYDFEEAAVQAVLRSLPTGAALDAACGTGRHLAFLETLGHSVSGFDASPEMLAHAGHRVPSAELRHGRIEAIPWPDATFDAAVCALALSHLEDLVPAVRELVRVLRPGGRLVISDVHPVRVLLDGHPVHGVGARGHFIRNHVHLHGSYLAAFREVALLVRDCLEPVVEEGCGPLRQTVDGPSATTARWAYLGLPMALVWDLEVSTPLSGLSLDP